jgi:hypothetical protein
MIAQWRVDEMLRLYGHRPAVIRWTEAPTTGGFLAVAVSADGEVSYYTPTAGWRLAGFRAGDVRHDATRALRRVMAERLGLRTRSRGRRVIITGR